VFVDHWDCNRLMTVYIILKRGDDITTFIIIYIRRATNNCHWCEGGSVKIISIPSITLQGPIDSVYYSVSSVPILLFLFSFFWKISIAIELPNLYDTCIPSRVLHSLQTESFGRCNGGRRFCFFNSIWNIVHTTSCAIFISYKTSNLNLM
jgi:hypothetical protein